MSKLIKSAADVKIGDRVEYKPHFTKRGAGFSGVVVAVGKEKLTIRDNGKRRSAAYAVGVTSNDWRRSIVVHHNFALLDARDIWRSERPVSPLAARYDSADRNPCIYSVSRVALLADRDAVIAEVDAMRAWLAREPGGDL